MENHIVKDLIFKSSSTSVTDFMTEIIKEKEDDESFYVLDLRAVIEQYNRWKKYLPTIKPYYAIKCNDTTLLLEVLLALGAGFDCASQAEIKKVFEIGATPDDIIYANPTKVVTHLKYAKDCGVSLMTFDSVCELEKVQKHFPEARLVLRIRVEAEKCLIPLGGKFGCEPDKAVELLKYAKSLDLTVVGISFHVGTGCHEPEAYPRAVHIAGDVINKAKENGIEIQYLDIGGGFPGDSMTMFEKIANLINGALDNERENLQGVKLIAEPGRFFACKSFTLAALITSVRKCESYNIYYVNNSIYGSFNSVYTEHATMYPLPLNNRSNHKKKCVIWGQTEEQADKITNECWLPEMRTGDWIFFKNMGAYSSVLSVNFYGFAVPQIYPIIDKEKW